MRTSDSLQRYLVASLRHHLMQENGEEYTPEFDQLEAELGMLWDKLTKAEQDHARRFSSLINQWFFDQWSSEMTEESREEGGE